MQLSIEQLAQFHKDGFIVLRKFLDVKQCDNILRMAQLYLDAKVEPIETEIGYGSRDKTYRTVVTDYTSHADEEQVIIRRLRQVYSRDVLFTAWMENEKIRPILQQILDDQVVITTAHHNSIMTKMAKISSKTCWHQDKRYWHFKDDNLLSVWLSLDDEYLDNGLLEFIPKSHKLKLKKNQFDKRVCFKEDLKKNKKLISKKVHQNLSKGDIVAFHCKTLHYASKNYTNKPKISFVYTVKGISTKAIKNSRSDFKEIKLK